MRKAIVLAVLVAVSGCATAAAPKYRAVGCRDLQLARAENNRTLNILSARTDLMELDYPLQVRALSPEPSLPPGEREQAIRRLRGEHMEITRAMAARRCPL